MSARFEIYKVLRGYRWRLKAHNGEPIAFSQNFYKTKDGAHKGIESLRFTAPTAPIIDLVPHKRYGRTPTQDEFKD